MWHRRHTRSFGQARWRQAGDAARAQSIRQASAVARCRSGAIDTAPMCVRAIPLTTRESPPRGPCNGRGAGARLARARIVPGTGLVALDAPAMTQMVHKRGVNALIQVRSTLVCGSERGWRTPKGGSPLRGMGRGSAGTGKSVAPIAGRARDATSRLRKHHRDPTSRRQMARMRQVADVARCRSALSARAGRSLPPRSSGYPFQNMDTLPASCSSGGGSPASQRNR